MAFGDLPQALSLATFAMDGFLVQGQGKQGPDYIQYGPNGVVRYELNTLMEFRDRYRVKSGKTK